MPNIYPPNWRVPELNGTASGGVTVVLHQPEELELLYAFSILAPRPPAAPLKSLATALADTRLELREASRVGQHYDQLHAVVGVGPGPKARFERPGH